jgi:type I restriction enzyme S subunit
MRDGWIEEKLGDVARVTSGFAFSTKSWRDKGIPVIKINNVRNGQVSIENCSYISEPVPEGASRFLLKQGDLLITLTGEIGAIGFVTQSQPMYLNQRVGRLDLLARDKVSLKFIGLFLSLPEVRAEMWSQGKGNAQLNISPTSIQSLTIKLPPPPEQKRIVDLISSVDSYIDALQLQLESAKRSRNAVLHELLTAGGDGWLEHKLIEMFEIYQPQTIAKSLMSEDGEFIVFGANGPIGRYHEFNHDEPEVVVTCRGATCGTINMTPPKTWITGNAMVVSPKTSGVSKEFLYWVLTAGVDIQSVISGSAQPQITREGLAPVKIKIPPLSRQIEIVDLISGFELNISHLEESLYKTKTLRSGLLSDLLSGAHEIPASYDKIMGAA